MQPSLNCLTSAKVIAHSSHRSANEELITLQVTFPRFILPEFLTHRVFSRNFSSSRAIPTAKLLEQVRTNPAMPIHWGKNQPGMQADVELDEAEAKHARQAWIDAAHLAANQAEFMSNLGAHKQIVNRILEPYLYVTGIVSSTEWGNFFGLRDHPAAQPEIKNLAQHMREAIEGSEARLLAPWEWHLPYVTLDEQRELLERKETSNLGPSISAARCCRVSYLKQDGTSPSIEDDLALCERLMKARPIHASPFEHQAKPLLDRRQSHLSGNFSGWMQNRKLIEEQLDALQRFGM